MPNVDNLNFKVIIDDAQFNQKIKAMEKMAKDFNTSLSSLLNVQAVSQELVVSNRKRKQMETDNVRAIERQNREKMKTEALERKLNESVEKTSKSYKAQSRILQDLKGLALGYLSVQGAGQFLSSLIRVTGEFELQKTTLAAMLGDLNTAEQVITRIQGLAVESPFQFKELTTYAKQLSAFSVPAQELYDTTKMLADISAGLGVGMDRIVLAYGQVRSAAFLRGQEVRQFTEAGIPILDELAKQFSELEGRAVSTNEVFDKISKRLVPFEMVAKVFKDMTSEGGKFYNMQEIQADTLRGKISNLKDAYEVMLNEIGKGQSENIKGAVDWARRLMQNYEDTGKALVELVVAYGVYKTALIGITAATNTFTLANHKLLSTLVSAGKWAATNPYILIATGLTAAGYAVYKAATGLQGYEKIQRSVNESISKYNVESAKEMANLDALYAKLNMATEGTEEYNKAKKSIYTEYASYISQLKEEGIAVDNLATIYENLKTKIEESVRARFRNTEAQSITQTYEAEMDTIYKRFEHMITRYQKMAKRELTFEEKEGLWQYILGNEEAWKRAEVEGLRNLINQDTYNKHQVNLIKKNVQEIVSAYQEGKAKLANVLGEDTTGTTTVNNPFVYDLEPETKGKSPEQKAIEERIKSIEKLKDAYEELLPYLNEVQMKSTLKSLFPNISEGVIDSLDFRAELERLAEELARFDKDAAQRLKDAIGKDVAGSIADSFKAIEQYKSMLDSWLGEDFNLSGEGTSFDISKIVRDLNNQYNRIDQKRLKALELLKKAEQGDAESLAIVRETLGEEVWQKYLIKGKEVIEELTRKEKESAKKVASEKIREQAKGYLNDLLGDKNIDLTDFGDKSIGQIRTILDRLNNVKQEIEGEIGYLERQSAIDEISGNVISDEDKSKLEMFKAALELLGIKIKDVGVELDKSLYKEASESIDAISSLTGEITNLGEALDSTSLANFGRLLSGVADIAKGTIGAIEDLDAQIKGLGKENGIGDWKSLSKEQLKDLDFSSVISAGASIAGVMLSAITNMIVEQREQQERLNETALEYQNILLQTRRDAYSGIFGTDELGLTIENTKILAEAQEKYNDALDKFENEKKIRNQQYFGAGFSFKKMSVSDVIGDIASDQGWELYRENGELNIDMLKSHYDAYAKYLTSKQKAVVDELIAGYDAQNEAANAQAQYLTELYGQVADTIANNMVDAFIESGDAAINMGEIVSDIAKSMVADLIKNLYILPILKKYEEQAKEIEASTSLTPSQKVEAELDLLDKAMSEVAGKSDEINAALDRVSQYFEKGESEGTTAMGEGFKGVTENTANLLVSYVNAVRADVSTSKTHLQSVDTNTQAIATALMGFSAPSLMEYQAKIEANTYNNMLATQAILSRLDSVLVYGNEGEAIRVYKDN